MSMGRVYNPKEGLLSKEEYIQRRVEALLGRSYQVKVNGYRYDVNTKMPLSERVNVIREAKHKSKSLPQSNHYILIDCRTRTMAFESSADMGGSIDGIPYMDYFLDTPFEDILIYEKLW